ncbi:MAG: 2,3-bisphosphoglycerate-independent phosphoglycerate mutase [Synechococcaceae bacterium WB4_2_0811]|nr:2,3-bisphosphoglycerate-independent phosphoglycerate mutase [Synechococcaceae bacterium WB4_2_0811]NBV69808.1 2,3-bisphosphoglycerate-independent phosphoglycerate mutase [Synechococcaceae bacterium WB4_2_0805]
MVLVILDGWGENPATNHNAIRLAKTPVMDALWHAYPHTLIQASGAHVGLPEGQMGNSEVGHLTIGSGRVIRQELVRISEEVKKGQFKQNQALNGMAAKLLETGGTLHLLGLLSDGGVHSHINHIGGLLKWAAAKKLKQVCIHGITDGRDTPTNSSIGFIKTLQQQIEAAGVGELTSLCGRYWAMDRDNRWERIEKAYLLLSQPGTCSKETAETVLARAHAEGISDEFLEPVRFQPEYFKPGDAVVLFNFRPDRMRQLTSCLVNPNFSGFERQLIQSLDVVTFTQYEKDLAVAVAFPPESLDDLLGEVISRNGLRQFRTAETEKYPHVTYFLNGGMEKPYPGEDRHLVPSPKVATYDQSPAMSAAALTNGCVAAIRKGIYSFVVINYANPDMVGHTGDLNATIEAISCVDQCIGKLLSATGRMGGTLLITADHGNAELMQGADGRPWTAHTTNPVPFILVEGEQRKLAGLGGDIQLRADAGLADIAPTVLELLGIEVPEAMSGTSLVANNKAIQSTPTLV